MSMEATIYYKSGEACNGTAPPSVNLQYTFGSNFVKRLEDLDEAARDFKISEPSSFIWHNPINEEGELDQLSDDDYEAMIKQCDASKFWIPIAMGIEVFSKLATRFELTNDRWKVFVAMKAHASTPVEEEACLAAEVACFHATLLGAKAAEETGFHIQCE